MGNEVMLLLINVQECGDPYIKPRKRAASHPFPLHQSIVEFYALNKNLMKLMV